MEHYLVGQCVIDYTYGEGMTWTTIKLNKIIAIDDYITMINVKMTNQNDRWVCSDVLGDKKIRIKLNYPKTTSRHKKDKLKLHQKAIDNLHLWIYDNKCFYPIWCAGSNWSPNYTNDNTFEIYLTSGNKSTIKLDILDILNKINKLNKVKKVKKPLLKRDKLNKKGLDLNMY